MNNIIVLKMPKIYLLGELYVQRPTGIWSAGPAVSCIVRTCNIINLLICFILKSGTEWLPYKNTLHVHQEATQLRSHLQLSLV